MTSNINDYKLIRYYRLYIMLYIEHTCVVLFIFNQYFILSILTSDSSINDNDNNIYSLILLIVLMYLITYYYHNISISIMFSFFLYIFMMIFIFIFVLLLLLYLFYKVTNQIRTPDSAFII